MMTEWGGVSSQRRSRFERATRSLATFVRLHRSLRSLAPQRFASLCSLRSLAPFTGSLTHFAHSLVGPLKFLIMCSRCDRVSQEQTRFWSSLETRPTSFSYSCHVLISPFFLQVKRNDIRYRFFFLWDFMYADFSGPFHSLQNVFLRFTNLYTVKSRSSSYWL